MTGGLISMINSNEALQNIIKDVIALGRSGKGADVSWILDGIVRS
jgi:hypothetical protein